MLAIVAEALSQVNAPVAVAVLGTLDTMAQGIVLVRDAQLQCAPVSGVLLHPDQLVLLVVAVIPGFLRRALALLREVALVVVSVGPSAVVCRAVANICYV